MRFRCLPDSYPRYIGSQLCYPEGIRIRNRRCVRQLSAGRRRGCERGVAVATDRDEALHKRVIGPAETDADVPRLWELGKRGLEPRLAILEQVPFERNGRPNCAGRSTCKHGATASPV